jgi:hypothetical protein
VAISYPLAPQASATDHPDIGSTPGSYLIGQVEGSRQAGVLYLRRGSPWPGRVSRPPGMPAPGQLSR